MKNILSILLLSLATGSCANHSEKDKILQQFDSVNNELKKGELILVHDNLPLYDSVQLKWADTDKYGAIQQMYYQVNDLYGYLWELRRRFYLACGDSTGTQLPEVCRDSVALTNAFFLDKHSEAGVLLPQLALVTQQLTANATSQFARDMIKKLSSVTVERSLSAEKFMELYFKNRPPIVAIGILNSFEAQVNNTEQRILTDYLNQ